MSRLLPDARLHVYRGGHIALITEAAELAEEGKDYDGAIKAYQESIEFDPKFIKSYRSLGRIYRRKKDYNAAIKVYQEGIYLSQNLNFSIKNLSIASLIFEDT